VLIVSAVFLMLTAAGAAKFGIELNLSSANPRVAQPVTVVLWADADIGSDAVMRLVAVAPGWGIYGALRAESDGLDPAGPSFRVALTRDGSTWSGTARFRRPGRWRLVVPNWGAPGYAIPPPVIRIVRVATSPA
jgi:hypothetical protein